MILTGKCLEDFVDQCELDKSEFDKLPLSCKNALIIDFFDSAGIYISVLPTYNYFNKFFYAASEIDFNDIVYKVCLGNRTKATTEAIIKANEIFNSRNS